MSNGIEGNGQDDSNEASVGEITKPDTKTKLSPDELANAVKSLIEENGGTLKGLEFLTETDGAVGTHSYETLLVQKLGRALPESELVTKAK